MKSQRTQFVKIGRQLSSAIQGLPANVFITFVLFYLREQQQKQKLAVFFSHALVWL
jgi:hypothetical protein